MNAAPRPMVDVFVRWWPQSKMRTMLGGAVVERLRLQADARVTLLCALPTRQAAALPTFLDGLPVLFLEPDDFARSSRITADAMAHSATYVILDDDHLPIGKNWLSDGVLALSGRPEYSMLSAWSINGEVRDPGDGEGIFEAESCGTPCFVRKGTFTALMPFGEAQSYDLTLSAYLRARIGRIGFLRGVRYNHLGCGYSQVVPGHWGA